MLIKFCLRYPVAIPPPFCLGLNVYGILKYIKRFSYGVRSEFCWGFLVLYIHHFQVKIVFGSCNACNTWNNCKYPPSKGQNGWTDWSNFRTLHHHPGFVWGFSQTQNIFWGTFSGGGGHLAPLDLFLCTPLGVGVLVYLWFVNMIQLKLKPIPS